MMSSTTIPRRPLQDRTPHGRGSPPGISFKKVAVPFRSPYNSRHHPYHKHSAFDQYTHAHRNASKHNQRRTPSYESAPLLTRLSTSSSPQSPVNTLLDRIGAQADEEEEEEEGAIDSEDDVAVAQSDPSEPGELERETHKPVVVEPDEVERFLESVIGLPPPRVPDMSPSVCHLPRVHSPYTVFAHGHD